MISYMMARSTIIFTNNQNKCNYSSMDIMLFFNMHSCLIRIFQIKSIENNLSTIWLRFFSKNLDLIKLKNKAL